MRGSRFFLEAAKRHGVCFGAGIIGGEAAELVFDEVKDFTFMLTRHETTAGVMADGYARLTGQAQLAYSTFGPGMTNLLTGIACAALDRSPMLAVSAQVASPEIAYGHTHQCLDTVAIARSVTKFAHEITRIEEIPGVLTEAMLCAREGLEGPSFISFPRDVMGAVIDDKSATAMLERMPSAAPVPPSPPKPTDIKWLADQLQSAKRPIAIVGNLVYKHGAQRQLEAFVSRYQIPVVTTLASKGILPESHLLNVGTVNKYLEGFLSRCVLNEVFGTADLILLIGFDIAEDVKPDLWRCGLPKKEILLTPFRNPVESLLKGDREIIGDLSAALNSLSELGWRPESRDLALIKGLKLRKENYGRAGADGAAPTPAGIVRAMRKAIGPKGILCSDIGLHKQIAGLFTESSGPNTFCCSNGLGSFGTGLALGLGAKVARPDLPVAIVVGDGGFHSNSQDLETAVRYNIPVIVVVLKDDAYGLIKYYQLKGHKRLAHGEVQFGSVDFVALARANGCTASRITRNDELEPALVRAIASGAPALLEVPICYEEALQLLTIGAIPEPEPDRKPFAMPAFAGAVE
jgi:N2-(2-carboxyethyl)arginine synthase